MTTKRLRIFAGALIIGTLMLDLVVAEIQCLVPATVQPSDANFINNPGDSAAAFARVASEKGQPCDLIFIGASNVEYWSTQGRAVWDKYYAPYHALNFGVAGDKTEDVLWRLDHVDFSAIHPRAAVIFVGLNNFNDTPRDLAAGVKAVVKRVQAKFPGVKVLIVSVTPSMREMRTVTEANAILRTFADNRTIYYIDLFSRMPRQGDNWKGLRADETHFTEEGYEMWAEAMDPVLQAIFEVPDNTGE